MRPVECVAFMLVQNHHVLAEQRKRTKRLLPGAIAFPGGHLEAGEQPEDALHRELQEELALVPLEPAYVCTLLHDAQEFRKLHYFVVARWQGDIQMHEADALLWVPFHSLATLDLDVDRIAMAEYMRLSSSPGHLP